MRERVKLFPLLFTLVGGGITAVTTYYFQYEINKFLVYIFIAMFVFFVIGLLTKEILLNFEKKIRDREAEEEMRILKEKSEKEKEINEEKARLKKEEEERIEEERYAKIKERDEIERTEKERLREERIKKQERIRDRRKAEEEEEERRKELIIQEREKQKKARYEKRLNRKMNKINNNN